MIEQEVLVRITESIVIDRPVEEVFEFITDLSTHHLWTGATKAELLSEPPVGEGSRMLYAGKFLGREMENESVITVWDPPRRMGYRIETGFKAEALQSLEPVGGATRMTWEYWGELPKMLAFFKMAEPLFAKQSKKYLRDALTKLKVELESSSDREQRPDTTAAAG